MLLSKIKYSPRLNCIEQWFNQVKHYLKLYKSKDLEELKRQEEFKNSYLGKLFSQQLAMVNKKMLEIQKEFIENKNFIDGIQWTDKIRSQLKIRLPK